MNKKKYTTILSALILMIFLAQFSTSSCFAWPRGERAKAKHWLIVDFIPRQYTYMQILQNKKLFDIYYKGLDTNKERRQARWDYESFRGGGSGGASNKGYGSKPVNEAKQVKGVITIPH